MNVIDDHVVYELLVATIDPAEAYTTERVCSVAWDEGTTVHIRLSSVDDWIDTGHSARDVNHAIEVATRSASNFASMASEEEAVEARKRHEQQLAEMATQQRERAEQELKRKIAIAVAVAAGVLALYLWAR